MARYIDADEIISQIENSTAETWGKGLGRAWWSHAVMVKDNFVSLIKKAPTVNVDPKTGAVREIICEVDSLLDQQALGDIDDKELYYLFAVIKEKYKEDTDE